MFKIVFYGRSLGALVAESISLRVNVDGIIIESSPISLASELRAGLIKNWYLYPYQILPIELLLPRNYGMENLLRKQESGLIQSLSSGLISRWNLTTCCSCLQGRKNIA